MSGSQRKRPFASSTSAGHPSATNPPQSRIKKVKKTLDDTGRLSTAAILAEQSTSSASSYLSIRKPAGSSAGPSSSSASGSDYIELNTDDNIPTLAATCIQCITDNFAELYLDSSGKVRNDDEGARNAVAWMKLLPPKLGNRLLESLLDSTHRQRRTAGKEVSRITVSALSDLFLANKNITTFSLPSDFFRAAQAQYDPGHQLEDDFDPENDLAGPSHLFGKNSASSSSSRGQGSAERAANRALGRADRDRANLLHNLSRCSTLRMLNLSGQLKLQDGVAASLVKELPNLEDLNMKGCTEVGDEMVVQLARQAGLKGKLRVLNLNYTAVTVRGLKALFSRCKTLEVLKLASMNGFIDTAAQALVDPKAYIPQDWKVQPLANLQTLKLRSTKIGDAGLKAILPLCESLTSLDISFTQVKSLDMLLTSHISIHPNTSFEKLVLSGLALRSETILAKFFKSLSELDEERRTRLKTLKLGNLGLLDSQLLKLVSYLEKFENLEKVSLHSNKTLSTGTGSGIRKFLQDIGVRCRHLDLSYVPIAGRNLSEAILSDFESYDIDEPPASRLEIVLLDNTHVGDEVSLAISTLKNLVELHLEQAKITVEGMTTIMQGCPKLRIVNLTGCRGIPTRQRRDWFELYEKGEVGEED